MRATSQDMERNDSVALCMPYRLTCWCLATTALLGAVLTLSCGGGTTTLVQVQPIEVSVAPQTAQVVLGGQIQFSASVSGSSAGVTWSVSGPAGSGAASGTIGATGLYTAPAILPFPNTVTVTAASVANAADSATATVSIMNPAPVVSSISPATVNAGSGNTTLTVTGTGFTAQSVVELGSTALATTYGSGTQLTAVVTAAQLANAGSLPVAVTTPAPGGGTSGAVPLSVVVVVAVNPPAQTVVVGQAQQFTANVTGSTNQGATWSVNGVAGGYVTVGTVDSTGMYTAPAVPPAPNVVTVQAASLADPTRSATASVTITNPAPVVTSITPATVNAGSGNTTLTVTGTGFCAQSVVELGGTALATTYGSGTQLTAVVTAAQLANAGSLGVAVTTPTPGGGTSSAMTLSVVVVVAVNPPAQTVVVGQTQQFTASVTGSTNQGASWSVNGVPGGNATLGTVDSTGLYTGPAVPPTPNTLVITAASLVAPTQSGTATVTIVNPAPVVSTISPTTVNAGSGSTTLTVTGAGFCAQSVVELGSTALATTYGSGTQLTAVVAAAQLANAGSVGVAVTTPAPGGGTSSAVTLSVVIVVAVSPSAQTVMVGQAQQFTATVTGNTNQGATWSVNGVAGGYTTVGTIGSTGLYTAPAVPPTPNTLAVTAASAAAPSQSGTAAVTIVNPAPVVNSISPATVNAGSGSTTLTVTGTGFCAQSVVELGGTALATTYGSGTQLTAVVTAAQLANAGSVGVAVTTPAPGGGTSSALTLSVVVVVAVNPPAQTVVVGQTQQFTANVTGSTNQGAGWSVNGVSGGNATLGTIDNTGLYTAPAVPPTPNTLVITAASLVAPSQSATASVTIVNPAPVVSSISPATGFALSGATQITVTGSGFTPQSTVTVNGSAFPATLVSTTQLTATLSALMVAQPAAFNIVVSNPSPGGGKSGAAIFTVLAQGSVTATGNPQVALYSFSSPRAASVSIEFGTNTTYGKSTWVQNTPPGGGAVSILVAGMTANTAYHMRADVTFPEGTQFVDTDHAFTTGGLPAARVPQITVTNPNRLAPSPGAILLSLWPGNSNQAQIVAVDNAGNLIWYYDYNNSLGFPEPIKLLPNGHMLIGFGSQSAQGYTSGGTVQEIDLAGNLIRQFTVTDLNNWLSAAGYNLVVNSIHHDLLPLPNGHLIVLVNRFQTFTDLIGVPGAIPVLGDALIDLDQNHNVVWVWDSFNYLDVNRHPMNFPDWTHANSIIYSPDDGNLLLSMRHQCWVLKIDYEDGQGTGDILWRLGDQGSFALTNGGTDDWFYAQHYANIVSPNSTGVFNFEVFDNGNNRGILDSPPLACGAPGAPACYSRVPIYQVDEVGMTATILWQDNLSPVYSFWGGSAQQLNDTNVVFGMTTPSDDPTGARYMEVTNAPTPQIVLQMEVSGQNAYRAVHIPSLYPGVQW